VQLEPAARRAEAADRSRRGIRLLFGRYLTDAEARGLAQELARERTLALMEELERAGNELRL
jgi:hypothetical protein